MYRVAEVRPVFTGRAGAWVLVCLVSGEYRARCCLLLPEGCTPRLKRRGDTGWLRAWRAAWCESANTLPWMLTARTRTVYGVRYVEANRVRPCAGISKLVCGIRLPLTCVGRAFLWLPRGDGVRARRARLPGVVGDKESPKGKCHGWSVCGFFGQWAGFGC